jgi:hypothetical protein
LKYHSKGSVSHTTFEKEKNNLDNYDALVKRNLEKEKQFQTIVYQRDRCKPAVTKGVPKVQVGAKAFCRP